MTELEGQHLIEAYEKLKKEYDELQKEHTVVVVTVIKAMKSVGLWPVNANDNFASKAIKGVKSILFESMTHPKSFQERFQFLEDIYPLCEKYKDLNV
jgi:hypothetical protein